MGCHHIKDKGKYYSAARPEGDNIHSVIVYKDNLISSIYTEGITGIDIIGLVEHFQELYFLHAMAWICNVCNYNFYQNDSKKKNNELLDWLNAVECRNIEKNDEIMPLSTNILKQYINLPHYSFLKDGIDINTQKEFQIGFDINSERIVIPIYDELNTLIGVKGRACLPEEKNKYLYLYPCPRNKILYGLNKTLKNIKNNKEVIVYESEKSVLKAWSLGYKNAIALGGKSMSEVQIEKLIKLKTPITIALDKDVEDHKIKEMANKFKLFTEVSMIIDKWSLLDIKDSPIDKGMETWEYLYQNKIIVDNI